MSDDKKTDNQNKNKKNKRRTNSPLDKSGQTGLCDVHTPNTPEVSKRVNLVVYSSYGINQVMVGMTILQIWVVL